MEHKKEEEIEMIVNDEETQEIRNEFMSVLAMPMKGQNQRKLFQYKLEKSNTINNYINENVLFRMFNKCNSHLKFAAVYGMKFAQTLKEYDEYMLQIQNLQQQQEQMMRQESKPKEKEMDSKECQCEDVDESPDDKEVEEL